MVMERLDAVARHSENQDPTKQFAIAEAKRLLRDAKVKDPGPRDQASKVDQPIKAPTETPKSFEIPTVSEEVYKRTIEALAEEGINFRITIEPKSLGQLFEEENSREQGNRFGYINSSTSLRAIVPPQMEVAIDPNNFKIGGSNNLSTANQIKKILERERILKDVLRTKAGDEVANAISIMPMIKGSSSVLSQLDFAYQDKEGKLLFPDFHGRTDDQSVSGFVAHVGRAGPAGRLRVRGWGRGSWY